jgi:tellurite resistance protein TerC
MNEQLWMWALFLSIVLSLIIIDLGLLSSKQKAISAKESIITSCMYIGIGLLFSLWIWKTLGHNSAKEYITGFVIEKSLALDNIFVILLVFQFLQIPPKYQHRVLFWGIIGALASRAFLIILGAKLLASFSWITYVFAIFLIATGIKMLIITNKKLDINNNFVFQYMKKHLRITQEFQGSNFYVKKAGQLYFTPLFLALVIIEFFDLIFALDSIPAIFSITNDPYIVYTSNIFAILGMRSLYFALSSCIERFSYLKYSLAIVLVFIGSKVFIAHALGLEKFPTDVSLAITISIIAFGVIYSLYRAEPSKSN